MNYYLENNYQNSERVGTVILFYVNLSCITVNKNTIAWLSQLLAKLHILSLKEGTSVDGLADSFLEEQSFWVR